MGGRGLDRLFGEDGNDTLCDVDSPAGTHHMDGGDGNDMLWLTDVGAGSGFDAFSTCAVGVNQRYGDAATFAAPGFCLNMVFVEPLECTDPN